MVFSLAVTLFSLGMAQDSLPRVAILTTGGTIASRTDAPTLEGPVLVQAVPEVLRYSRVSVEEVVRIGSSQMTPEVWFTLARRINQLYRSDPDLAAVVVTHGTDTMEETGFFLNLTVQDPRPVVMVGSMRSANTISADGPSNLLQAVRVAVHPQAARRGVLVVLNDVIHAARDVWKTDNQRVGTFRSPDRGILGYADPDTVMFYRHPPERHTTASEFDIRTMQTPPRVALIADYAGYDGESIAWEIARGAGGIVVQTFAGGRMSAGARRGIAGAVSQGVPVVIASRVPGGRIPGQPIVPGSILARDLSAQKARVLLIVALAARLQGADLARVFAEY